MKEKSNLHFDTRSVHHPVLEMKADPSSTPIIQSSTFFLKDSAQGFEFAQSVQPSSFYTRWGNPTLEVLERVIADLEGGEAGLAFASGMAAISSTMLALLAPGDHLVASVSLYSGTKELINRDLRQLGVKIDFVDATNADNFAKACRSDTKVIYIETPDNPNMGITDIAVVAKVAKAKNIILAIDNTFASPAGQRPISLGADVVVHSATKYISGHSDVIAGLAVSSRALLDRIWRKHKVMGACLDPHAASLLLRGVKTLGLRMERQTHNAQKIAEFLQECSGVKAVYYPGLKSHPQHQIAAKQMLLFGAMISFDVGTKERGLRIVEKVKVARLGMSLGGVDSLIQHPASMTHSTLTDEELKQSGILPGLIRLSVGIENIDDLLADLKQALA